MKSRKDFPELLNLMGLTGRGVEVGVAEGHFSECILKSWVGRELLLVDPYQWQFSKLDRSDKEQQQHDFNYGQAVYRMVNSPWCRSRHKFVVKKSVEAAAEIPDVSLDFVYIDAKHDYRSVWADLTAWYPKVKVGGVIAGHDYKNSFVRKNLVEVRRAVDRFFLDREEILSTTEDNLPSFYVIKQ